MKLNLLKKLLTLTPVVISPILVTACGSEKTPNSPGEFYLDFYQKELDAVWSTKQADINALVANPKEHDYDLKSKVLDEVVTKIKNSDAAAAFKKAFPDLNDYDASIFDAIKVSFSIPNNNKGNLKLTGNILTIFPGNIISDGNSNRRIDYTLKLNSSKLPAEEISNGLWFKLNSRFVKYDTATTNKLGSNNVTREYGSGDMSTILVGTQGGGIDVGTKQAAGGYKFDNYNSSKGLANNNVEAVYGSTDMSTILVGTYEGGVDVGTRAKVSDPYTFKTYGTGPGLPSNSIQGFFGTADLSTILVGANEGGLSVGTRASNGNYSFKNYNTGSSGKEKLADDTVTGVYGTADLSTILLGEFGGGIDVGTKQNDGTYDFANYNERSAGTKKLASSSIEGVYGNADMSTILVGTDAGLDVGTRAKASDPYAFKNYSTSSSGSSKISNDDVWSAYGNAAMSTILVGTNGGGLDVGTKKNDGTYEFKDYNTSSSTPVASNKVLSVFGNTDLSTILVGGFDGGLDISSNLWFA